MKRTYTQSIPKRYDRDADSLREIHVFDNYKEQLKD